MCGGVESAARKHWSAAHSVAVRSDNLMLSATCEQSEVCDLRPPECTVAADDVL